MTPDAAMRLVALKPALRGTWKRSMPLASAARKSGVENGYLPSQTSDSPSTVIIVRPSIWPRPGALSRKRSSICSAQIPAGSI